MTYYLDKNGEFVPAGSVEAATGVAESDIDRLGLRDKLDAFLAPAPPEPSPEPEPPKQAKRPADKMVRAHQDK